jgi:Lon protease-like protein
MSSMHSIGTAAVVVQVTGTNWPRPSYTLLVTGLCRFRLETLLQESPYIVASVTQLDKLDKDFGTYIHLFSIHVLMKYNILTYIINIHVEN